MIVGICGKPGAGKDTIGSLLTEKHGFKLMTFKKPIEDAVKAIFAVDDRHLYDRVAREEPLEDWPDWTVRKLLQGVAQSLRDLVGEHLWGQSFCMRSNYDPKTSRIVVTDIRTPGDVACIRHHVTTKGGKFVLMGVKRQGFGSTTPGGFANHKLESYDLDPECDVIFQNDGTIADLHAKVEDHMIGVGLLPKPFKVKCDHAFSSGHQCESSGCIHRLPHFLTKDCGSKWCTRPGEISPLDGHDDGSVVECVEVDGNKAT